MTSYEDGYRGRGYRGRGRGRGSSYRGRGGRGRSGSSDWYGHDDRGETGGDYHDEDVGPYTNYNVQVDSHGGRHVTSPGGVGGGVGGPPRAAPPPPPPTDQSRRPKVQIVEEGWQYRDPEGAEHGPFMAAKMVKWIDQKYFSLGLEVRKVTRRGAGAWTELKYVLGDIKREAALTIIPAAAASPGLSVNVGGGGERGGGAPPPPPPPHSPAFEEVSYGRGGRGSSRGGRGGGRGRGEDYDFDYGVDQGYGGGRGDRGRGGDRGGRGGRFSERGGRSDRGGRGERGGRGGRFAERGGGRGDRGGRGRGGRGGRGAGGPSSEDVAAAVSKLFTGEVYLGTEQPMWRYIDPQGNMQGPFPAQDMESWYSEGYLANPALKVCGTERKVAPPNLPPPEFFIPLGALIYWVRRGHKFTPITVADVVAKKLPEELQKLKDGAEKVAVVPPPSTEKKEGEDVGKGDNKDEEDTSNLAATMAKLAVSNVLVANGEHVAKVEEEEEKEEEKVEDAGNAKESEEDDDKFVEANEEETPHDGDDTASGEGDVSIATQESCVGEN